MKNERIDQEVFDRTVKSGRDFVNANKGKFPTQEMLISLISIAIIEDINTEGNIVRIVPHMGDYKHRQVGKFLRLFGDRYPAQQRWTKDKAGVFRLCDQ